MENSRELASEIYDNYIIENGGISSPSRHLLPLLSKEERDEILEKVDMFCNPVEELDSSEKHRLQIVADLLGRDALHYGSIDYYLNPDTDNKIQQYMGPRGLRDL